MKKEQQEAILSQYAEALISRLETMEKSDWKKGWLSPQYMLPQNLSGRAYNYGNAFFLKLFSMMKDWQIPVFMTFNQAVNEGLKIKSGEKALPVLFFDRQFLKDGKYIGGREYDDLTKEEQKEYKFVPLLKKYLVFNVDQTNMAEVMKERYNGLLDKATKQQYSKDDNGMYQNAAFDNILAKQDWHCPIHLKETDGAFYNKTRDFIVLPLKAQFGVSKNPDERYKDGMEFYSTAAHEMAHSTGHPSRLNREMGGSDKKLYAKEELLAELSASMVGNMMGFDKRISDNNLNYLKGWVDILREEPKYILSLMSGVSKATNMIMDKLNGYQLSEDVTNKYAIVQMSNGTYSLRNRHSCISPWLIFVV